MNETNITCMRHICIFECLFHTRLCRRRSVVVEIFQIQILKATDWWRYKTFLVVKPGEGKCSIRINLWKSTVKQKKKSWKSLNIFKVLTSIFMMKLVFSSTIQNRNLGYIGITDKYSIYSFVVIVKMTSHSFSNVLLLSTNDFTKDKTSFILFI